MSLEARRARLRMRRLELSAGRKPNIGRRYMYFASDTGTIDEANPTIAPSAGINDMIIKRRDGGSEKGKRAVIKFSTPISADTNSSGLLYCEEALHPGTDSETAPLLTTIRMTYTSPPTFGLIIGALNIRIIETDFDITDITWNNQADYGSLLGASFSPYQYEALTINADKKIVMVMQGFW